MATTLLVQSMRAQACHGWLARCMASVREYAQRHGYDYLFVGDELFEHLPAWYLDKVGARTAIAADLGRLLLMQQLMNTREDIEQIAWFDADVLVFDPAFRLDLLGTDDTCAFGREVWISADAGRPGRLRVHRSLHNAVCTFRRGCPCCLF